jgi:hypothetical protein
VTELKLAENMRSWYPQGINEHIRRCTADADADADEDVDVMLDSLCFSCPPTIVDEQCNVNLIVGVLILKKK